VRRPPGKPLVAKSPAKSVLRVQPEQYCRESNTESTYVEFRKPTTRKSGVANPARKMRSKTSLTTALCAR
jgi:hypothetical protein